MRTQFDAVATTRNDDGEGSRLVAELAGLSPADPRRARARDRAIEAWLPLAHHLARRYCGKGEPYDDLVQVALEGLIKAVDRYDAEHGVEFVGFAIPTILGEIKRHFRDRTWSVRVPRRLQELRLRIGAANSALSQDLGRPPTAADVAAHLGVTEEEVLEGLEGARAYQSSSLSAPASAGNDTPLGETIGVSDPGFELAELRTALEPALATLDDRARRIVAMTFYGNLTQAQIAAQLGISQMHVSRLLARSVATLRRHILEAG